jgi:hypothetical protein
VKTIKEILSSRRFMREISLLLFFFAGLSTLVGVLLLASGNSDPEVIGTAIANLVDAVIDVALAILIRRGSIKALWVAAILFVLETLFHLLEPTGSGLKAAIISRGILIFVLVRYIRRERNRVDDTPQPEAEQDVSTTSQS